MILLAVLLSFPPHGFGSALPDFAFFLIFAIIADMNYRPERAYRWAAFLLCVIVAVLFFFSWLADLGAHL